MKNMLMIFLTFYSFLALSQDYNDISFSQMPSDYALEISKVFFKHGFWNLKSDEGFTNIKVNQIFFNKNAKGFIAVKYGVSGDIQHNIIQETELGLLLHVPFKLSTVAFYFKGIDLKIVKKLGLDLKNINLDNQMRTVINNILPIQIAVADCGIEGLEELPNTSAISTVSKISSSSTTSMLWSCLSGAGTGIKDELYGSAIDTAKLITKEVRDFWNNPTTKIGEYYKAVDGVISGFQNLMFIIGECISDPANGAKLLKQKLGETGEYFAQIFIKIATLPAEIATEMLCSFLSGVGVNSIMAAFTGGTGLVILGKSLIKVRNVLDKLSNLFDIVKKSKLASLSDLGLDKLMQNKLFSKIKDGNLDMRKLQIFNDSLMEESSLLKKMALGGLQCSL